MYRYAGAVAIAGDYLVLYGGSGTPSESSDSEACFLASLNAVDLACGAWSGVEYYNDTGASFVPSGRLGHDLFVRNGLLHAIGGTSGWPELQVLVLEHDRCAWWSSATTCEADAQCAWNATVGCREAVTATPDPAVVTADVVGLPEPPPPLCALCARLVTASDCDRAYAAGGCVWCAANSTCIAVDVQAGDGPNTPAIVAQCSRNDTCFSGTPGEHARRSSPNRSRLRSHPPTRRSGPTHLRFRPHPLTVLPVPAACRSGPTHSPFRSHPLAAPHQPAQDPSY